MDQEFIDIITRMTKERGADILVDGSWKKWLADYTGPWYPKKTARFKQILNTNCAEYINSAQDVPERKQALLERLEDGEGLSPKVTAEYLDLLGLLLKGDTSKCGAASPQTAPTIPSPAAPAAPDGMVWIPGGSFMMGSPASEPGRKNDETRHEVRLSGFYMGKYTVTQKEWREMTGYNPSSKFKMNNRPVGNISWHDAVNYCNALSLREGLNPAYTMGDYESVHNVNWNRSANGYRLPTEAEWEYACRAGTTTRYSSGSSVDAAGWYEKNSEGKPHHVGKKQANAWGLYDMHGNVWEWCWDRYGAYPGGVQTDPVGASSGSDRVARGGGWNDSDANIRSACRSDIISFGRWATWETVKTLDVGFRLARSL